MKRCIVCGNIGNDDSAICNVCGNPYIDLDDTSDDDTTSSEVIEKMEAQLRQVWTKVQSDGVTGQTEAHESVKSAEKEVQETEETSAAGAKEPGVTVLSNEDTFSTLGAVSEDSSAVKNEGASQKSPVKTYETVLPANDEFSEEWFESVSLDDVQKRVEEVLQKSTPAGVSEKNTGARTQAAAAEEKVRQAEERAHQEETARQAAQSARQEEAARQAAQSARQEEAARQAAESVRQEEAARQAAESVHQEVTSREAEEAREAEVLRQAEEKARQAEAAEEARKAESEAAWRAEVERQTEMARQEEAAQQAEIARQAEEMARATGQGTPADGEPGLSQEQPGMAAQGANTSSGGKNQSRARRSRSGPQIYGQVDTEGYNGAQGVIRRDVHDGQVEETIPGNNGYVKTAADRQSPPPRRHTNAAEGRGTQQRMPENTQQRTNAQPYAQGNTARDSRGGQSAGRQASPADARSAAGNRTAAYGAPQGNRPLQGNQPSGLTKRVQEAAKDAIGSPLLIVIAFFQTLYFASSVEAIFLRQLNYAQFAKLLNLIDLPSQVSGYVSMFQSAMAQLDSGALALNLLIRVPDLLFCLGLWLLCITVHTTKERMSGAGFLFMQIVVVIRMIVACVLLLVVLVLSVTLVIASWSAGTQNLLTIAIVTLVAAIVVTMMVIMYYFCYLSTIRVIKNNARDGVLCGKVSGYVAVITMIVSLTGIISLLSGIVNLEVTGITSGVGRIAWMVLFGVWILKYKSTLKEYNENR